MSEVGGQSSKLPYGQQVQAPNPDPVIPMRPDWHHGAPCNGKVGLFYPKGKGRNGHNLYEVCRPICAACPFLDQCREEVLSTELTHQRFGFRAGMSPVERQAASGTWKKFRPSPCIICGEEAAARRKYCSDTCRYAARRRSA